KYRLDWHMTGIYTVSAEVLSMLSGFGYFAVLVLDPGPNNTFALETELYAEPGNYTVCKLYGINDCWSDPPPAQDNSTLQFNHTYNLNDNAYYNCHTEFHVWWSTSVLTYRRPCRGQLGGWGAGAPKCHPDACMQNLPAASSHITKTINVDYREENGNVTYSCPANMSTLDRQTEQIVICTKSPRKFEFLPKVVNDCVVCNTQPVVANASVVWDNTTLWVIGDNMTVTCMEKYHLHGDVVTQNITCTATGWEDATDCVLIPYLSTNFQYCFADPPPAPSPLISNTTSADFRNASGTVTYTCPDLMATRDGRSEQVVTCSETPTEYVFLPVSVDDCDVCLGTPTVENATVDWDPSVSYTVQSYVTATCNSSYLAEGDVTTQVVTCNSTGWEVVAGCYPACVDDPPLPGETMTLMPYDYRGVGSILHYNCSPGLFLRQNDELLNGTTAVCGDDLIWKLTHSPLICDTPVWTFPMTPNGTTCDLQEAPNWPGTTFNCTCEEGLMGVTGDDSTSVTVTVEEWVFEDPEFYCVNGTTVPPPVAPSGVLATQLDPPYVIGTTITYACEEGTESSTGQDQYNITLAATGWPELDPRNTAIHYYVRSSSEMWSLRYCVSYWLSSTVYAFHSLYVCGSTQPIVASSAQENKWVSGS
ncbi:uncharacterized protein LOC122244631, partial [Penaeus japonicus]|uniref:uncharacterized protein LOC122244631 n=1 Tax=Penaeus japonicus TaxID=27405 RepID=UPI001C70E53D